MKTTKREKNAILIVFGFHLLLFFTILFFSITYYYPEIKLIELKKIELKKLYENKLEIEKKWITFNDFKDLNNNSKDAYYKNLISNLNNDFYVENFINNWEWDFENFINKKTKTINDWENQAKLLLNNEEVSKVLPSYLENNIWNEKNLLSNFRFINYVESILKTFNIKSSDKIWINNIELLWDYKELNWKNNNLESNIFAIPLNLTIEWKKEWIINFLYFAQNVWNIEIDDNNFEVYKDDFLSDRFWKTILKWDNSNNATYNIYKNQFFDIEYIKFWDYIDESSQIRNKTNFITFLKNTQWNSTYKIDVKLNFYVKWIQQYELIEYIESIINNYFDLNKKVNSVLNSTKIDEYDKINYKKVSSYLKEIQKEITNLNKELKKRENLEQLYNKVIKYNTVFTQINKLINN